MFSSLCTAPCCPFFGKYMRSSEIFMVQYQRNQVLQYWMFSNFAVTSKILISTHNAIVLRWPPGISTHHINFQSDDHGINEIKIFNFFMISALVQEMSDSSLRNDGSGSLEVFILFVVLSPAVNVEKISCLVSLREICHYKVYYYTLGMKLEILIDLTDYLTSGCLHTPGRTFMSILENSSLSNILT